MTFYRYLHLRILSESHIVIMIVLLFVGTGLGPVVFMYSPEDRPMDAPSDGTEE